MHINRPAFVFVHGAWHDSGTWRRVLPGLSEKGFDVHALDLPGAGKNAKIPSTYLQRPLDLEAFTVEPSPNAAVTQEERTSAVIDIIRAINQPVILVGHSMGGATISDVAEAVPELLTAVVYLAAFLLPQGISPITMSAHETMAGAVVPSLFRADPAHVGALRLDPRTEDLVYRAKLKAAFYGDVTEAEFTCAIMRLHCDEPVTTMLRPSAVTAERYGRVERHYIRCTQDLAIPLAAQDHMIAAMDRSMGNRTRQHTLISSHSPFYSQPQELLDLLVRISGDGPFDHE